VTQSDEEYVRQLQREEEEALIAARRVRQTNEALQFEALLKQESTCSACSRAIVHNDYLLPMPTTACGHRLCRDCITTTIQSLLHRASFTPQVLITSSLP
jgi:hypothetical protein